MNPACPDCTQAELRRWYGFTLPACRSCVAREIARGSLFRNSRIAKVQERPYRELLERAQVTHEQVLAAHAADWMTQERV